MAKPHTPTHKPITISGAKTISYLTPNDPPLYNLYNPDSKAKVIFICDHASNYIPPSLDNLGLDERTRALHIAYDIGAAHATKYLADFFKAPAFFANYSRLITDLNRPIDDAMLIPEISDHIPIPGNASLRDEERKARIETFHTPYHNAIEKFINNYTANGDIPAIIAIHSCTPHMDGFERPWEIGTMWHKEDRIALPLIKQLRERGDIYVGDNQPYTANDPFGYTIYHHAYSKRYPHIGIEFRQDLMDTKENSNHWAEILAKEFDKILKKDKLYQIGNY